MMPSLWISRLTKTFGTLKAVDDFSLEIASGTVHSLVGENGAGKSTVVKCVYGLYSPTAGKFKIDNKILTIKTPRDAMKYGIGMVHQHFMLVPSLPVYKNVVLGDEPTTRGLIFNHHGAIEAVRHLSAQYGLNIDPLAPVHSLPVGIQQRVEILKLLYRKAEILIFDEPTAVLSPREIEGLFSIIREFRKAGKTIIFIAHNLNEVLAVSDVITVMRKGKHIATLPRSEATSEELASLMVGRSVHIPVLEETPSRELKPFLEMTRLTVSGDRGKDVVKNLTLTVHRGEIVGIAGITGNGQSELEEAISGLRFVKEGQILMGKRDITHLPPLKRRKLGLAYIPEDRIKTGLAPLASLKDNALLGYQYKPPFLKRNFFQNFRSIREFALHLMERYNIMAASENIQAGTLSGGNMQRLVMARELEQQPDFLLVSQPTRGVDIGGISFIHDRLLSLRRAGKAILMISADLDEILSLSDRIAVMNRGEIVAVLPRKEASRNLVGRLMLEGSFVRGKEASS
jgi:simple sugar transport system ATP-binding protein